MLKLPNVPNFNLLFHICERLSIYDTFNGIWVPQDPVTAQGGRLLE